jgi:hypothetical protein
VKKLTLLLFFILNFINVRAQQSEFENWKKQQEEEFNQYKNKFDLEFNELLENTWIKLDNQRSITQYKRSKPNQIPSFDSEIIRKNSIKSIEIQTSESSEIIKVDEFQFISPKIFTSKTEAVSLKYYSVPITIEYPSKLVQTFNERQFSEHKLDEKYISNFWRIISSVDHSEFISYLLEIKSDLNLNDWSYLLLINQISESLFRTDEIVKLSNWFMLTHSGFDNKIGYTQDGIYNLLSSDSDIYRMDYYTLDRKKYYPIRYGRFNQNPGSIFTYEGKHKFQVKVFKFSDIQYPIVPYNNQQLNKEFKFDYKSIEYTYALNIDTQLIEHFEFYPLVDLETYFESSFSDQMLNQIRDTFLPLISEMEDLEAANFLLAMVQKSFQYKTDQDNFSREKFMFPEETFYYEYSDCDDRSILYANLISELLGLDVIGLRYSRHLAVAINFNTQQDIGDSYLFKEKNYVVADPTYIGAPVGKTMTQYKNETPKLIEITNKKRLTY